MYFLYSLILAAGFLLLLPRFLYDVLRYGKYAAGLGERAGMVPLLANENHPLIWLHCVSVGETQAARPLVRALLNEFPNYSLVVSTTTLTGQRLAREVFRHEARAVVYFPFDWAWSVRRALGRINPSVVLIMETELWPRFLRECRRRATPVAIINGRLSARSFRRYRIISDFIKRVVNDVALALMQTEADAERMRALGCSPARVKVTGNLKDDERASALAEELRTRFHLKDGRPLIVAASTHAPEERIALEAFKKLRATTIGHSARLLIAPRHPERFNDVTALLALSNFTWIKRTNEPAPQDSDCDIILLNSIGELRAAYTLADLVFVGGSLAPHFGGHNVLEPAASGACIITGAHTSNFSAIIGAFQAANALVQLPSITNHDEAARVLAQTFAELLTNEDRRGALIARARDVLAANRGATVRTVESLAPLLNASSEIAASQKQKPPEKQRNAISP
jgi:3-deoxy-D-manno-octulosonic-acid transferase